MKEKLSTVGIIAIFMAIAFWGGFVASNVRWQGIVEDRVIQGQDDFMSAELHRVSEMFRDCEVEKNAQRREKTDAMDKLSTTQWDRDHKYADWLNCEETLFVVEQDRDICHWDLEEYRSLYTDVFFQMSNFERKYLACESQLEESK